MIVGSNNFSNSLARISATHFPDVRDYFCVFIAKLSRSVMLVAALGPKLFMTYRLEGFISFFVLVIGSSSHRSLSRLVGEHYEQMKSGEVMVSHADLVDVCALSKSYSKSLISPKLSFSPGIYSYG